MQGKTKVAASFFLPGMEIQVPHSYVLSNILHLEYYFFCCPDFTRHLDAWTLKLLKSLKHLMKSKGSPNVEWQIVIDGYKSESNLFHLLCATGFHALGFGILQGPTVTC